MGTVEHAGRATHYTPAVRSATCQAMTVSFDIGGRPGELSEGTAELIAENLHNFSVGPSHRYYRDVEMLARAGVDPSWTQGAKARADIIEDALIGVHDRPIPLDPRGKAA